MLRACGRNAQTTYHLLVLTHKETATTVSVATELVPGPEPRVSVWAPLTRQDG
jgi:hypothetical protein